MECQGWGKINFTHHAAKNPAMQVTAKMCLRLHWALWHLRVSCKYLPPAQLISWHKQLVYIYIFGHLYSWFDEFMSAPSKTRANSPRRGSTRSRSLAGHKFRPMLEQLSGTMALEPRLIGQRNRPGENKSRTPVGAKIIKKWFLMLWLASRAILWNK